MPLSLQLRAHENERGRGKPTGQQTEPGVSSGGDIVHRMRTVTENAVASARSIPTATSIAWLGTDRPSRTVRPRTR